MQPRICRLCLKQTNTAINIFQHHFDSSVQSLVEILFWTFLIEVDASDSFSKSICLQCLSEIENVVSLRKTFKRNQMLLKQGVEQLFNTMNSSAKNEHDSVKKDAGVSTNYENLRTIRDKDRIVYRTEVSDIDGLIIEELTLDNEETERSFSCDHDNSIESVGDENILDGWPKLSFQQSQSTSTNLTMEYTEPVKKPLCDKNTDRQYIKISKSNLAYFSPRVSVENFKSAVANEQYKQIDERTFKKQYCNASSKTLNSDCGYVKVPKYALDIFCPKVTLTDIKKTSDFKNYQQVSDFSYKIYPSRNKESQRNMKYIDYYYNYNSCALRELITEKSMQYSKYSADIDEPEIDSAAICELCNARCNCDVNYDVLYTTCRKVCDLVGSGRNEGSIKKSTSYKQAPYLKSSLHLKRIKHYKIKRKKRVKKKLKKSIIQNMYYKHFDTNIFDSSVSTDINNCSMRKDCKYNKFLRNTIKKLSQRLLPTVVIK